MSSLAVTSPEFYVPGTRLVQAHQFEFGKPDDPASEVVATVKLRHILLLQDGTNAGREDVTVARINSVTEKKKAKGNWYAKLQSGIHPAHKLIGTLPEHGTNGKEAYVDLLSVTTIRKSHRGGRMAAALRRFANPF